MKEYIIDIDFKKFSNLYSLEKKLGSEAKEHLLQLLKKHRKEVNEHFKKNDWHINFQYIIDDITKHLLGQEIFSFVAGQIINKNINLIFKDNKILLSKGKKNVNKTVRKKTKPKRKRNT